MMVLKEQLKNIGMTKAESVVHYLGRVKQVHDDLNAIGETVAPTKLVSVMKLAHKKIEKIDKRLRI